MFRESTMRIIALFVAACIFVVPLNSFGQTPSDAISAKNAPKFTYVLTGKISPFTGYLFSPEAVIKITSDTEFKLRTSVLDKEYAVKRTEADYQLKLDTLKISYDSLKEQKDKIDKIKDEEIANLRKIVEKNNSPLSGPIWFAIGTGTGIAVVIVLYFAINAAVK